MVKLCWLVALTFATVLAGTDAFALQSTGESFICDSDKMECSCKGAEDCVKMCSGSAVCTCDPAGCTKPWAGHKTAPNPSIKTTPQNQ
jgi:hypothetical protein